MTEVAPRDLSALFEPSSIAVVGVGSDPMSPGTRVFRNLRRTFEGRRFAGRVHGVNRNGAEIDGMATHTGLAEIGEVPDLVVVATPSESVEALVKECAELGVRAMVVLSAGFGEAGAEGEAAQARLVAVAGAAGIAMVGPNSMGLLGRPADVVATFTNAVEEPNPGGRLAVVGQSGGMAAIIYTILVSQGIGVDYLVALGNEADVSFGDVAHWLLAEDRVDTVVGFVESVAGWASLSAAAGVAAKRGATIAICRAGRSAAGASAAASHVGAVAGDDAVLADLCRSEGIIEVPSLDGLVDAAKARALARPLQGDRIGVVTASGGAGTLLADLLSDAGFAIPTLSPELQARVYDVIPWFGSAANPVDTTAYVQNRPEVFGDVVELLCASGELDAVQVFLGTLDPIAERLIASISGVACAHPGVPVLVTWGGGSRRFKRDMARAGVPTYDDPGRAVTGLLGLRRRAPSAGRPVPTGAPPSIALPAHLVGVAGATTLNEHEVRDLLEPLGLPLVPGRLATSPDDAVKAAIDLNGAVVLKLMAPGAEHKSDLGGVVVGIKGEDEVARVSAELLALAEAHRFEADGILVEQLAPAGTEVLCAIRRDPVVGPVVVVGLGGRLTEVLAEAQIRPAPLDRAGAHEAIAALCDGRLVAHHRGLSPTAVDALADLLVRLGELAVGASWLHELELNPVIVAGDRLAICDGLATTAPQPSATEEPAR